MTAPAGPDRATAPTGATGRSADDERSTTAARRVVLLVVAALATALGAAIVVLAGRAADDAAATLDGPEVTAIGPEPGVAVGTHLAERAEALASLDGRAVAVVSFDRYVAAAEVAELLGPDVSPVALLVALPGTAPSITTDPAAFRAATVDEARSQLTELTGLLPTVDDEEFAAFYAAEIIRYEQVLAGAERADLVFAAVVRASGPQFRALASRPEVRSVDAVAGVDLADDATVAGLRPEETAVTGEPEFRPA